MFLIVENNIIHEENIVVACKKFDEIYENREKENIHWGKRRKSYEKRVNFPHINKDKHIYCE